MKQIVLIREKEKLVYIGKVSCVDEPTLAQLEKELVKNVEEKEKKIALLEEELENIKSRLLKCERELAYNRGDLNSLEGDE